MPPAPRQAPHIIFTTARLVARRIVPADAAAMLDVYGDADAMRWVGDGTALNLAQCEEWIAVTRRNYAMRGYGMFALESRRQGDVVGFCGIVHPGDQPEPEIKYALRRRFWGQGLATEAATAMLKKAPSLGLCHVIATAAPENVGSLAVLQKAGMQRGPVIDNGGGSRTQLFTWPADACLAPPMQRSS